MMIWKDDTYTVPLIRMLVLLISVCNIGPCLHYFSVKNNLKYKISFIRVENRIMTMMNIGDSLEKTTSVCQMFFNNCFPDHSAKRHTRIKIAVLNIWQDIFKRYMYKHLSYNLHVCLELWTFDYTRFSYHFV